MAQPFGAPPAPSVRVTPLPSLYRGSARLDLRLDHFEIEARSALPGREFLEDNGRFPRHFFVGTDMKRPDRRPLRAARREGRFR